MTNQTDETIRHRYDFVLLFDVKNGNPNGDPDAGNAPRFGPETGHGLVSDVALKRKIRDYVTLAKRGLDDSKPEDGYDIYVQHRGVLEQLHRTAYEALGLDAEKKGDADAVVQARRWMCQTYWDVRTFGAVMSTGVNCGQVRGPVQITFARSLDPIAAQEQSITRKAVATQREADEQIAKHGMVTGTMGDKQIVPYGLYRAHGFVSPHLAAGTGFRKADLGLLWTALGQMFEHDRSASRGEMSMRGLYLFEHESALGNAQAHRLFDRVTVERLDSEAPPRGFQDYAVHLDIDDLPAGVTFHDLT